MKIEKILKILFHDIYFDLILIGLLFYIAHFYFQQKPFDVIALAISLVSLLLWIVARIQLGDSFNVVPKATKLVTKGLYSKIRNPIYIFSELTMLGIFLIINNLFLYLLLIPHLLMQITRAQLEEKVLNEKFGKEYLEYKENTWF